MTEREDKSLVRECLEGDTRAFEILVDRYQKVLYNVALRMLHNQEDAMDATQTAFVKAYEKLDTFNPQFKFFSWIYKIMVNESLNMISRRKPQDEVNPSLVSHDKNPEENYQESVLIEQVNAAIVELPLEYRRVVVLRHFGNLSYREMSGALDIPEKTVKSRLFTARRMLQEILLKMGAVSA